MPATSQIELITGITADEIAASIKDESLILLSPRLRNRNSFIAWFTSFGVATFFHALAPSDTTLVEFLKNVVDKGRDVDREFGSQLTQALNSRSASIEDYADAFAMDISKIRPKLDFVVLDNFDYLQPSNDNDMFFLRLVRNFPKGIRLVINSRVLATQPWATLIREQKAVALGDDKTLDGGIFDPQKPNEAHLEVYALAGGNTYVNGWPITTWDGPLPKQLFYYFVDHPMATRDEIFAVFWPDLPTKEATNVFHVTKRKISERLGFELTAYASAFYRPSGQMAIHYDVQNFEALLQTASFEDEDITEIPQAWLDLIRLYRTPFLPQMTTPWIEKRREQLKQAYTGVLIGIGRVYNARNDATNAITYYMRALREYPEREDVHRELMRLHAAHHDVDKVVEQYKMLTSILKRTLNIAPSKTTRQYYEGLIGHELASR
ncbi:MAG: bacterial transcriptional activator domain-containing protein [Anaerolineae bacterium]|nr:bacterial transcriptional activator domain-containing protein [Anaerolineae bacterium]